MKRRRAGAAASEARPAQGGGTTRLPEWWRTAAVVAAGTRVLYVALAYAAAWLLATSGKGPLDEALLAMWERWDATLLVRIAKAGYTSPAGDPHASAFFPLLPLVMRGFWLAGVSPALGGMIVNLAACIVAFAYLWRLAEEDIGAGAGRRAVLYLALFPTSVFLVAPYTEPLFLAGAVPAFYYARRGQWPAVALPAAVATAARFAGLFVLLGLAAEVVRRRDFAPRTLMRAGAALATGVAPLLAYMAYLAAVKGDALDFFTDQRLGWGRGFVGPVASFKATWGTWDTATYPTNWILAWRIEVFAAVTGIAFTIWALVKREWGYAAFMGSMMAVLVTSSWYYSIPRMLLSLFPIVLLLAAAARTPARHEAALVVLAPLAAVGVVVYTRGGWFF